MLLSTVVMRRLCPLAGNQFSQFLWYRDALAGEVYIISAIGFVEVYVAIEKCVGKSFAQMLSDVSLNFRLPLIDGLARVFACFGVPFRKFIVICHEDSAINFLQPA